MTRFRLSVVGVRHQPNLDILCSFYATKTSRQPLEALCGFSPQVRRGSRQDRVRLAATTCSLIGKAGTIDAEPRRPRRSVPQGHLGRHVSPGCTSPRPTGVDYCDQAPFRPVYPAQLIAHQSGPLVSTRPVTFGQFASQRAGSASRIRDGSVPSMGRVVGPRSAVMQRTIRRQAERALDLGNGPPRVARPRHARRVMWNSHATSAVHVNHKPVRPEPPGDLPLDESATRAYPLF
jgi:hypothetical protein